MKINLKWQYLCVSLVSVLGASVALAKSDVTFSPDLKRSQILWTGSKVTGKHNGTIQLKSGSLTYKKGTPRSGKFVVDMNTISNKDIENPKYRKKLESHLKSPDFFAVSQFPEATFKVTRFKKLDNKALHPMYQVHGKLTIRGLTHTIQFPATFKREGKGLEVSGGVRIDRTKWNVRYNSGKFFDVKKLGDKMIDDQMAIDFQLFFTEK